MIFQFTTAERRVFRARERDEHGNRLSVSQWAERYRVVVKGPAQGMWTNAYTPYCVFPMDLFTVPSIRDIYLQWGPQTGKTQVAINCLLYAADQDPGPAMYIMPDEKVSRRISRRQLMPTFRATPRIAALMSDRADDTTALAITLQNGMDLSMAWATSPAVMASESMRYMFFDEPGKYPPFSGREASPFDLGRVRTNAYPYTCKRMYYTTPAEEGDAWSQEWQDRPDVIYSYLAKCPVCGHEQVMTSAGLVVAGGEKDPRTIRRKKLGRYQCENCPVEWNDIMRDQAVMTYQWRPDREVRRPSAVGLHLPSWYSKMVSLSDVCADRAAGMKDLAKLMAYITQGKAESFRPRVENQSESEILSKKSKYPAGIVPPEAIALTAGIDVQKHGFWYVIRAWDVELTSWLVHYGFVATFQDLEAVLFETEWPVFGSDEKLPIWRAAIDTGGGVSADDDWSRTEEVYMWLRSEKVAPYGRVFGIKGASRPQIRRIKTTVIDKMPGKSAPIPGGLQLFFLDTEQIKDIIAWRLTRKEGESQRFYLSSDTGMDYVKQFLAQEKRRGRRGPAKWTQIGGRADHLKDCEVYAAACADSEWIPSLPMLAQRVKSAKNETAEPPAERKSAEKPKRERKSRW